MPVSSLAICSLLCSKFSCTRLAQPVWKWWATPLTMAQRPWSMGIPHSGQISTPLAPKERSRGRNQSRKARMRFMVPGLSRNVTAIILELTVSS